MKILITGSKGFIGKNLIVRLKEEGIYELLEYDMDTPQELLESYCEICDSVVHLAGINRPKSDKEFMQGNCDFTEKLIEKLKKSHNKAPIIVTSSIQAERDNLYGKSKKAGEEVLIKYGEETGNRVCIYRLPNVFGKWCRPNYNSAVATFCYNIARGLPITVTDPNINLQLVYIDDVVEEIIAAVESKNTAYKKYYYKVPKVYTATLGEITKLLYGFKASRVSLDVPEVSSEFIKVLYSTYTSYLPEEAFKYPLVMHEDQRGSFTEIIKTLERGQFSVNVAKPGITKGNHWHHTKVEKFLVVYGKGCIKFRKIGTDKVITYHVSGEKLEVVDIPVGYTHSISNEGEEDLITFMWCNECFDPNHPDTYYEEVEHGEA